jgi:hypothetical protein
MINKNTTGCGGSSRDDRFRSEVRDIGVEKKNEQLAGWALAQRKAEVLQTVCPLALS